MNRDAWNPTDDTVPLLIDRFALHYATGTLTAVARGSMGQIWRLDLTGPTVRDTGITDGRLMIKQFFWGADETAEQHARAEAEFCRAAAAAGLTLTQSLPAADGTYVHRLPTQVGEVVLRLNTWASGRELRPTDPGRAEYLGRTLGILHALRFPANSQPDPYFTIPPSEDAWDVLLAKVAPPAQRIPSLAHVLRTPDDVMVDITCPVATCV